MLRPHRESRNAECETGRSKIHHHRQPKRAIHVRRVQIVPQMMRTYPERVTGRVWAERRVSEMSGQAPPERQGCPPRNTEAEERRAPGLVGSD